MPASALSRSLVRLASLFAVAPLLLSTGAEASEFSVSPIRVELKPSALTETVTITNYSDTPLRVSARLSEWSQDEKGADVYKDSGDLVYFPRQLDLPAQGKRLIRIGTKSTSTTVERTFRLFIEEEAPPGGIPGAQVNFFFRFGVPVFLPPPTGRAESAVESMELSPGRAEVRVVNNGNQHVRLTRVAVTNDAGFRAETAGWYLLAGAARTYSFDLPRPECEKSKTLRFTVEGEGDVRLERTFNVAPGSCH